MFISLSGTNSYKVASCSVEGLPICCLNFLLAAVIGQTKLLPPEKMKHSLKLVDDQMNWCDSAMEVRICLTLLKLWILFVYFILLLICSKITFYLRSNINLAMSGHGQLIFKQTFKQTRTSLHS